MVHIGIAATSAFKDVSPLSVSLRRWKRLAFALLLSGLFMCLPARGHAAGLDCPETGPGRYPLFIGALQRHRGRRRQGFGGEG